MRPDLRSTRPNSDRLGERDQPYRLTMDDDHILDGRMLSQADNFISGHGKSERDIKDATPVRGGAA